MTILEFFEHLFEWNFYMGRGFEYAIVMYIIMFCCIIIAVSSVITAIHSVRLERQQNRLLTKLSRSVNNIVNKIEIPGRDESENKPEEHQEDSKN